MEGGEIQEVEVKKIGVFSIAKHSALLGILTGLVLGIISTFVFFRFPQISNYMGTYSTGSGVGPPYIWASEINMWGSAINNFATFAPGAFLLRKSNEWEGAYAFFGLQVSCEAS